MRFRLTPRSMTLDDRDLLKARIISELKDFVDFGVNNS